MKTFRGKIPQDRQLKDVSLLKREVLKYVRFAGTLINQTTFHNEYNTLGKAILKLWTLSGKTHTVKYLKECQMMVFKTLSGDPYKRGPNAPYVAHRKGIPSIIPSGLRDVILNNDPLSIKGVLTVLSVYRVIHCRPSLKLGTIIDPFTGVSPKWNIKHVHQAMKILGIKKGRSSSQELEWTFHHSSSAGPNSSISTAGMTNDALGFLIEWRSLRAFWNLTARVARGWNLKLLFARAIGVSILCGHRWSQRKTCYLGKLVTKNEPAGKVRVFAITDWWTQNVLRPLHLYLFRLLSRIPIDGTFDQDAQVKRAMKISKGKPCYSFDLSAATDRLPVLFQEQVLSAIFDEEFASNWRILITDRNWQLKGFAPLKYAVGQPMGAYSSWAILALSHHLIVQRAAHLGGWKTRFEGYSVLGDDVVIFDKTVASHYLTLIDELGVGVNLSKSLQSETGYMEFAKRFTSNDHDLSPLGAKAMVIGIRNVKDMQVTLVDAAQKSVFTIVEAPVLVQNLRTNNFLKPSKCYEVLMALVGFGGILNQEYLITDSMNLEGKVHLDRFVVRQIQASINDYLHNKARRVISRLEDEVRKEISKIYDPTSIWFPCIQNEWEKVLAFLFHPGIVKYQERLGEILVSTKVIEGSSPEITRLLTVLAPYDPFTARRSRSITADSLRELIAMDPLRDCLIDWGKTTTENKKAPRFGVTHKEIMSYLTLAFFEFSSYSASYPTSTVSKREDGEVGD